MRLARASRALLFLVVAGLIAGVPAVALDGTIVDTEGEPIENAKVCYVVGNAELLCSNTDAKGAWKLPTSSTDTLRAVAEGYLPRRFSASTVVGPVALDGAPTLFVRLVNGANGKKIRKGEVSVVYSDGHETGPFPVNKAGVRIRRVLRVGDVRILARASGFRQEKPQSVTLTAGEVTELTIRLTPETGS